MFGQSEEIGLLYRLELILPVSVKGSTELLHKRHRTRHKTFEIHKDFLNCESRKATLVEPQNKNIEVEMNIIGPL